MLSENSLVPLPSFGLEKSRCATGNVLQSCIYTRYRFDWFSSEKPFVTVLLSHIWHHFLTWRKPDMTGLGIRHRSIWLDGPTSGFHKM